jgi:hypothetical protein
MTYRICTNEKIRLKVPKSSYMKSIYYLSILPLPLKSDNKRLKLEWHFKKIKPQSTETVLFLPHIAVIHSSKKSTILIE